MLPTEPVSTFFTLERQFCTFSYRHSPLDSATVWHLAVMPFQVLRSIELLSTPITGYLQGLPLRCRHPASLYIHTYIHTSSSSSSCVRIISSLPNLGFTSFCLAASTSGSAVHVPLLHHPMFVHSSLLRNCAGRFPSSFLPTMSIHGHSRALGSATRTRDLHSPQVSHTATTIPDQVNDDRPFEGVSFKPVYLGVII